MSYSYDRPEAGAAAELPLAENFPPVEPPSAGFIVQLFIVPAVIVVVIATVVGLVYWLAQMGNDPGSYVDALERDNAARWQVAVSLAEALRNPAHAELRLDSRLARRLGAVLERQIAEGKMGEEDIMLRVYLCHTLGQFQVPEALPPLILAANTQRSEEEVEVRASGLRDLTLYISTAPEVSASTQTELAALFQKASQADEPVIRSTAAFGLSAMAGWEAGLDRRAMDRLERMLSDPYPDVRYNAACTMALRGEPNCIGVLTEMLEPTQAASLQLEAKEAYREAKRLTILQNALRAVEALATQDETADLTGLQNQLQYLLEADLLLSQKITQESVRVEVRRVLQMLNER